MEHLAELTDAQLVVRIARRDDGALAEIYRRHARAIYGLARRVVGDVAEAEDVTQEAFPICGPVPSASMPGGDRCGPTS